MTLVLPIELMADCLLVENTLILSKNETRGSFFVYFFLPLSLSELELELEADPDRFYTYVLVYRLGFYGLTS
jgi:hypothetical protein